MGGIVGRWLKRGNHRLYDTSFKSKQGAKREAIKAAKRKREEAGEPFRWGDHWIVYTHKKR